MIKIIALLTSLLALSAISAPAGAETFAFYSCKAPDGTTLLSNEPCGADAMTLDVKVHLTTPPPGSDHLVRRGMTHEAVVRAWGTADRKHSFNGPDGNRDQWIYRREYGPPLIVYFKDGEVEGWSD